MGRDPKLAKSLWNSKIYEMKILSILIDDPKTMTIDQAKRRSNNSRADTSRMSSSPVTRPLQKRHSLSNSPTNGSRAETTCAADAVMDCSTRSRKTRRRAHQTKRIFLRIYAGIDKKRNKASIPLLMSMAGALMGIGLRTKKLNREALKVARAIGPITQQRNV